MKKDSEPSTSVVCILGISLAGFGVLLGFIYLTTFPLPAYSNLSEREKALEERESIAPNPGEAYYIEGPVSRSRAWESARKQFIDGSVSTLTVTAGEINAWFASRFRSSVPPAGEDDEKLLIVPKILNMGISREGEIYLNLPVEIAGFGIDGEYVFSAVVSYAEGAPASLQIKHLQIGGAPVPLAGILGAQFVSKIMQAYSSAEEFQLVSKAWQRVQSVEAKDGALVLTLNKL